VNDLSSLVDLSFKENAGVWGYGETKHWGRLADAAQHENKTRHRIIVAESLIEIIYY
jgi:hypothetical protein